MKIHDHERVTEWFMGPKFLYTNEYPKRKINKEDTNEELRPLFANVNVHEETEYRVSKWQKLRRTYAFVFTFVSNTRLANQKENLNLGPISKFEYLKAENYLFKKCQQEGYPREYIELKSGQHIKDQKSEIFKESPCIDENGILRARSRFQSNQSFPYEVRKPIILPKTHRITNMVLQYYHEKYHHQFQATVLNEVRQKFAIPSLKSQLKHIRRNCQQCKNNDARPKVPEQGELPSARLAAFTRPFSHVGIDYFGPMYVVVGRRREKRWCMLVTCLTTRAIHLEVVHSLSTDGCIQGIIRFINRRGKPLQIYTDNGTNFRGSRNELKSVWTEINKNKVAESFIDSETEWKFIPPASRHICVEHGSGW